jgi:hypothetical protein
VVTVVEEPATPTDAIEDAAGPLLKVVVVVSLRANVLLDP